MIAKSPSNHPRSHQRIKHKPRAGSQGTESTAEHKACKYFGVDFLFFPSLANRLSAMRRKFIATPYVTHNLSKKMGKNRAMVSFTFRMDRPTIQELRERADQQHVPVSILIRRLVVEYLDECQGNDLLGQMEARLIATLDRLSRYQLQTRRVTDIAVAQGEFLRQIIVNATAKPYENETSQAFRLRKQQIFLDWLPPALSKNGVVRGMIRDVMYPSAQNTDMKSNPEQDSGVDEEP